MIISTSVAVCPCCSTGTATFTYCGQCAIPTSAVAVFQGATVRPTQLNGAIPLVIPPPGTTGYDYTLQFSADAGFNCEQVVGLCSGEPDCLTLYPTLIDCRFRAACGPCIHLQIFCTTDPDGDPALCAGLFISEFSDNGAAGSGSPCAGESNPPQASNVYLSSYIKLSNIFGPGTGTGSPPNTCSPLYLVFRDWNVDLANYFTGDDPDPVHYAFPAGIGSLELVVVA